MILDKIDNYKLYENLSQRLAKGFVFINTTDLVAIELGTYEIEGKDIFAIVQEYDTKDAVYCKLESHKKYIDIQYVISGVEMMGVTTKKGQKVLEVNDEKDYTFYEGETSWVRVDEGMFTVFFPDDVHRPGVKAEQITKVKKVVIKVLV